MTHISLYQIVTNQNHSRRNGSTWVTQYPSFRSTAAREKTDGPTRCSIVVQTDASFAGPVFAVLRRLRKKGHHGISIDAVASQSDEETLKLIRILRHQTDVFALLSQNTERVKAELLELRPLGIPVIALVSDLDPSARTTYIGIDNRAAGELAGFVFGRSLGQELGIEVAIVRCEWAYRCWEDREIGFQSLLKQQFPQIRIVEVVMEADSPQAGSKAALQVLSNGQALGGIYNIVGENLGLADALSRVRLRRRPLYITHELDQVAEPLLRTGAIDFLITQSLESVVNTVRRFVLSLRTGVDPCEGMTFVPIELISKFNLRSRATP
jgi:LacI family transcriptional regulator